MRADETSAAGDENPHGASVKTKPETSSRSTQISVAGCYSLFVDPVPVSDFIFGDALRKLWPELTRPKKLDPAFRLPSALELASIPTATRFDFPLGSENGAMAYNAQPFTENRHLGDDLNGIGGENSDLGDPIYAMADGRVLLARDAGPGWGNVIIVLHAYIDNGRAKICAVVLRARGINAGACGR